MTDFQNPVNAGNVARIGQVTGVPFFKASSTEVVNAHATPNTLMDVPELSFPVMAGRKYKFKYNFFYTAAAATTGSRWVINGPAAPTFLSFASWYQLTSTTETVTYGTAYQQPAAANASSATAGNQGFIEGLLVPSVNGVVTLQFSSEITVSAITFKYGTLEYWEI